VGEQRNVLEAFAQRRNLDGEDIQAVVQIFPQLTVGNGLLRITVGRRDDPGVDVDLFVAAHPPELSFLQDAQQLDLQLDRHLGDLVEEHRSTLGHLEVAFPPLDGVGKGAFLVAEDLRLDQRR